MSLRMEGQKPDRSLSDPKQLVGVVSGEYKQNAETCGFFGTICITFSARYHMSDLDKIGGVPVVMRETCVFSESSLCQVSVFFACQVPDRSCWMPASCMETA